MDTVFDQPMMPMAVLPVKRETTLPFRDSIRASLPQDDEAALMLEMHDELEMENKQPGVVFEETLEELEEIAEDIVTKPAHYAKWVIEPISFIMRNGFEFWRGNIVKYASRAGYKLYEGQDAVQSEITDLKKVIRYAEMRINQLNGEVEL